MHINNGLFQAEESMSFFAEYVGSRPGPHQVQCFYSRVGAVDVVPQLSEVSEIGWFSTRELPVDRTDKVDFVIELFNKSKLV